jgi:hypothetical protein
MSEAVDQSCAGDLLKKTSFKSISCGATFLRFDHRSTPAPLRQVKKIGTKVLLCIADDMAKQFETVEKWTPRCWLLGCSVESSFEAASHAVGLPTASWTE